MVRYSGRLITRRSLTEAQAYLMRHKKSFSYVADLKGASEVPPTDSKGTGKVDATSDAASKKRTWTITYSGLTGDAVAAHFHGPAAPGANAAPVVPSRQAREPD